MRNEELQQLLDRFLAGTSSLEEEARLAQYFRSADVSEELQPYKEMFAWFEGGMKSNDELGILNDDLSASPMLNDEIKNAELVGQKRWRWAAAAAVALLLLGGGAVWWHERAQTESPIVAVQTPKSDDEPDKLKTNSEKTTANQPTDTTAVKPIPAAESRQSQPRKSSKPRRLRSMDVPPRPLMAQNEQAPTAEKPMSEAEQKALTELQRRGELETLLVEMALDVQQKELDRVLAGMEADGDDDEDVERY